KTAKCAAIHLLVRSHPPFSAQPSTFDENHSAYPSTVRFEATKKNSYPHEIINKKNGTMFAK
ncbi:hypothetical protein F6E19_23030, partial [Salmonella enterica subsp. enterica serovar Kentucky]|nr:hypothetical protein [Salmonella enterica subsp. enterica serovar Kentucky]